MPRNEQTTIRRLFGVIHRIEEWILAWAMIAIAVLTITNVFTRQFLGLSLAFIEELDQFLIILITFVGLSYAAGKGRHIRMTAVYDQIPDQQRKYWRMFIAATTAILLFVLAAHSMYYIVVMADLGSMSPALRVPLWLVYLAAPLGLIMGGIQYVLTAWRNAVSPGVWLSYEVEDVYEEEEAAHRENDTI